MIIWDKKNGYTYKDEATSKEYTLHELMCYKGTATSDIVGIWDEENNCFANYVYGAEFLDESIEELNNTIKFYVDAYEADQKSKVKAKVFVKYNLDKAGVKAWSGDVVDDILEREITGDYTISHGNRIINLPDLAQIHELLEHFLEDAEEEANA